MPRIAIATCSQLPQLDDDGPRLLAALRHADADVDVEVHAWDDPRVRWHHYDAVLVRSTWDYTLRRQEFLAWAHACRRTVNAAEVLAWNTDKRYLQDLATAGVAVVPTVFLDPGQDPDDWPWDGDVVVKPTVSASAADTGRYRAGDPAGKEPLLRGYGTRAPVVGDAAASLVRPTSATPAQLRLGEAALAAVPGGPQRLAYARVDLVPAADGSPVLLELELTEPSLFLAGAEDAAVQRLAEHVVRLAAAP